MWLINIQVVAKQTGNKVERIGNKVERSTLLPICYRFRQQLNSTLLPVCTGLKGVNCHDSRATCHIAGCKNSIRHIENRFSPYFILFCF